MRYAYQAHVKRYGTGTSESQLSKRLNEAGKPILKAEILSKVIAGIASFILQSSDRSWQGEREWAYLVADEDEFENLINHLNEDQTIIDTKIDVSQLATAVALLCLSPENVGSPVATQRLATAFEEVYSLVRSKVVNVGLHDPVLFRDVAIAWGNGWHRANFNVRADGWDGRWIKALLALSFLMERAVEHALKLLSHSVDKLFSPGSADPDDPGHQSVISSYASLLAASAAANCCDCGSNKCAAKHRLSIWSPRADNGRAFPLRALAAQMARGDAGPKFLNKEFQNSALYPLLRDYHGLRYHQKVEFKLCHECGRKYEKGECRCGTQADPVRTKHFVFENAFWVDEHKQYVKRRRQLCRKPDCRNLYSIEDFDACPLCGTRRTPNRYTSVFVLKQRLDSRAVLQDDYADHDSIQSAAIDEEGIDSSEYEQLRDDQKPLTTITPVEPFPSSENLLAVVQELVSEAKNAGMLTVAEASDITERARIGGVGLKELKGLAVLRLQARVYDDVKRSADLVPELAAELDDIIFNRERLPEAIARAVVTARARLLSKRGSIAGVLTDGMVERFLALSNEAESLVDALEASVGVEAVIRTAELAAQARDAHQLSASHARQSMTEALRGYTDLDAIEENSDRIRAYILSSVARRMGLIEESVAWTIKDKADNGFITPGTLAELSVKIETASRVSGV